MVCPLILPANSSMCGPYVIANKWTCLACCCYRNVDVSCRDIGLRTKRAVVLGIRGTTTLCDALTDAVGDAAKALPITLPVAVFQDPAWLQQEAALLSRFRNVPGFLPIKQCSSESLKRQPDDLPCCLLFPPRPARVLFWNERGRL